MNYRQRKKIEKIVAMCILSFAVVVIIAVYSFVKLGDVRRQNAKNNEYILALELKQKSLSSDVNDMKTNEYLEDQARDNFDMIKDDETLYIYK